MLKKTGAGRGEKKTASVPCVKSCAPSGRGESSARGGASGMWGPGRRALVLENRGERQSWNLGDAVREARKSVGSRATSGEEVSAGAAREEVLVSRDRCGWGGRFSSGRESKKGLGKCGGGRAEVVWLCDELVVKG